MCFEQGLLLGLAFGTLDIHEEVGAFDKVFSGLKGIQVIGFDEVNHIVEQRIERSIFLQILNSVYYHNK